MSSKDIQYNFETIRDIKRSTINGKRKILVFVKWEGYEEKDNSWEPLENFTHHTCEDELYDLRETDISRYKKGLINEALDYFGKIQEAIPNNPKAYTPSSIEEEEEKRPVKKRKKTLKTIGQIQKEKKEKRDRKKKEKKEKEAEKKEKKEKKVEKKEKKEDKKEAESLKESVDKVNKEPVLHDNGLLEIDFSSKTEQQKKDVKVKSKNKDISKKPKLTKPSNTDQIDTVIYEDLRLEDGEMKATKIIKKGNGMSYSLGAVNVYQEIEKQPSTYNLCKLICDTYIMCYEEETDVQKLLVLKATNNLK